LEDLIRYKWLEFRKTVFKLLSLMGKNYADKLTAKNKMVGRLYSVGIVYSVKARVDDGEAVMKVTKGTEALEEK